MTTTPPHPQINSGAPEIDTLIFTRDNIAFQAVAVFLMSIQGFASLVEVYNSEEKRALKWEDDDNGVLDCITCGKRLKWHPNEAMLYMTRNTWPQNIVFYVSPHQHGTSRNTPSIGTAWPYLFAISQYMLTSVFEGHKHRIMKRYGNLRKWPACWRFAHVLRNALSHNGKIKISDNHTYEWNGLIYSSELNDRMLLHNDIFEGDIIILLHEMSNFI